MSNGFELIVLTVDIKLPLEQEDALDKIVNRLAEVSLKLKTVSEISLAYKTLRQAIPRMTFNDDEFSMQLQKDELQISIGDEGSRRFDLGRSPEQVKDALKKAFDKTNLTQISSEVNYVLGLILGQIKTTKKPTVTGTVVLESSSIQFNFNHLLNRKIIPGKTSETILNGVQFVCSEEMWDRNVETRYRFMQSKDKAIARILFSFELSSPLDLSLLTYTLVDKLNNTFKQIEK